MTVLEDNIALRDKYLVEHGLEIKDFGLNYSFAPVPATSYEWYKDFKFGYNKVYRRAGLFLVYLNPQGEPYLQDEVPYGVVRFLGAPAAVPEGEEAPKVIAQWGRRSEIHFEPMRDGTSWESLTHGSKVIHCESLVKAKAVHKATGLPCIGYNGVNGYSSAKQGIELIHQYTDFAFDKMDNIILFDSDVHTNPRVMKAREGLSHKLRHILNAPLVSWASLPQRVTEGAPPSNWGPDDFILSMGSDALLKIILNAEPYQDEEFSSLVEEMNDRAMWVTGQKAVYERVLRSLIGAHPANLEFKNVNRVVVNGKTKRTVFGFDVWMQSKHRLEVANVGYRYMGEEVYDLAGQRIANLYVPDGVAPGYESLRESDLIYQLLLRLFKDDDLEQMRSYLKFLKFTDYKPASYCVLWSTTRGVGKGWFTRLAKALLGERHVHPSTADQLAEKYNLHTVSCRLLEVNEFATSSPANKKMAINYLKAYVGDETIMVRAMHRDPFKAEVRAGLIITVNNKADMPSDGLGDRRQWYVEAGAGMRERGLEIWEPESKEWSQVFEALNDGPQLERFARWVVEGKDVDFRSWRPVMTAERADDLLEGMSGVVWAAYEVRKDLIEKGVTVTDTAKLRPLIERKMEVGQLEVNGRTLGKMLREAGWWTDTSKYGTCSDNNSAAWFVGPSDMNKSEVNAKIKADYKLYQGKY